MTEYDDSPSGQTQGSRGKPGAQMLDVLIRNLEAAKADFEREKDFEAAEGPVFCTLFYVTPGQICPFYYYHSLTEETKPVE
jgi:hypothetical protein